FSVAESDESRSDAPFCGKSFRRPRKNQERFAALFFANIDVAPAHRFADSGAERFRHCFFARETRGQMAFREFHRHRIFNFTICEDSMQKSVSESLDRTLDARAFDHINADTDHAHAFIWTEQPAVARQALRLPPAGDGNRSGCPTILPELRAFIP